MNKILTISIAGYNVEQYIENTLSSICAKDVIDDIEIFVVDDGGKDKTLEITKKYQIKYPNSVFPVHKENGGYGSVINTVIQLASGKYFKQLDGDDWFDTKNFIQFVKLLKTIDVDYVSTPRIEVNEKHKTETELDFFSYLDEGIYSFDEIEMRNGMGMHTSTFRTSILKKMGRCIREHCFYTDVELVYFPLPLMNTIYICHSPIYMYRIGLDGQSISPAGVRKHYKEHELVFWELYEVYEDLKKNNDNKSKLMSIRMRDEIYAQFVFYELLDCNNTHKNELIEFYNELKLKVPEILEMAIKKCKLVKLLVYTNFTLYKVLGVIIKKQKE